VITGKKQKITVNNLREKCLKDSVYSGAVRFCCCENRGSKEREHKHEKKIIIDGY